MVDRAVTPTDEILAGSGLGPLLWCFRGSFLRDSVASVRKGGSLDLVSAIGRGCVRGFGIPRPKLERIEESWAYGLRPTEAQE